MLRLAVVACLLVPRPSEAQPEVTFDEALGLGVRHPGVVAAERELRVREAEDVGIGGTWRPTTITLMPGALVAPDQDRGFELQVAVTQGWNLADLGGARREAAREERAVLAAAHRLAALDARLEAARRWVELFAIQQVEVGLDRRLELADRTVSLRERALARGAGTAEELAEARAARAALQRLRLDAEGSRVEVARALALSLGADPTQLPRAVGPLPEPTLPPDPHRHADRLETLPAVARARLAAVAARARAVEEEAGWAPVLSLGAQLERTAADSWVLFAIATLAFDPSGSARRGASRERAASARAEGDATLALLRARADVEDAIHEVEHTSQTLRVLEDELLPAARELTTLRERRVAAHEETAFALLEARQRHLAAREARVRIRCQHVWARVRLWLLLAQLAEEG